MTRSGFGLTCWPSDGSKMMTAKARTITTEKTNFILKILVWETSSRTDWLKCGVVVVVVVVLLTGWTEYRWRSCPHIYTKNYLTDFTRDRKCSVKNNVRANSSSWVMPKKQRKQIHCWFFVEEEEDKKVAMTVPPWFETYNFRWLDA